MTNYLLIAGSALCMEEDRRTAETVFGECDIMAVGMDAIPKLRDCAGRIKYVVTNHAEDIPEIISRVNAINVSDYRIVSPLPGPGIDIVEPYRPPSGSSAITGALAALRMGYERIILCGCPLAGNAPEGNPYEAFRPGWESKKDELAGKVKSMSGWTRELLGYPTKEWLSDECAD